MRLGGTAAIVLGALALAGCGQGAGENVSGGDASRGKVLFVKGESGKPACGACHALKDAGTQGRVGPDLDAAFASDRAQGFAESTIRQVVADQIRYPGNYGSDGPTMPPHVVTGSNVDAVAAYVASVAGKGGVETATGATAAGGAAGGGAGTTTQQTGTQQATTQAGGGGGADLAAGKSAFTANGCSGCHTLKAAGATGNVGPDLDKLKTYAKNAGKPLEDFIHESIVDPNAYTEKGFPKGVMPPFSGLPASTIDALVKFLAASATS